MHSREFGPKNDYCLEGFTDGDCRKGHGETNGLQPLSLVCLLNLFNVGVIIYKAYNI